jgi:hypothetical protein
MDKVRQQLVNDTALMRETLAQNEAALEAWTARIKSSFSKSRGASSLTGGRSAFAGRRGK